jgi:hypothetical protein
MGSRASIEAVELRSAEVRELCRATVPAGNELGICKAKTDLGCPRCGLPLCERHMPEGGMRCGDCEAGYARRVRENVGRYVVGASLVLGLVGAVMVALTFVFGTVLAVLPVAAVAATAVVLLMSPMGFDRVFGKALPRRAFLKERRRIGRAAAGGDEPGIRRRGGGPRARDLV